MDAKLFGGIEAGGTKFVCAIGAGPNDIRAEKRFPTTSPGKTIDKAINFFNEYKLTNPISAVGIASFGPVDLNLESPNYGSITTTPKPGWRNASFAKVVSDKLGVPVGFDTDVNGALLGEQRWGSAQNLKNAVYLTVGTGIGGGAMVNGHLVHGLVHPEMGHILLIPHKDDPMPGGICPYHGACLEGMASGPAIEKRWEISGHQLAADHFAWELEAIYLAQALHSIICVLSPERIILGGGVMDQKHLFSMVQHLVKESLNNYIQNERLVERIDEYIVPPGLGNRAGVLGAIALAQDVVS
jgi:fructokinase